MPWKKGAPLLHTASCLQVLQGQYRKAWLSAVLLSLGNGRGMQLRDMRLHGMILMSWALYQSLKMLHMPGILHDNFAPENHVFEAFHITAQESPGQGKGGLP